MRSSVACARCRRSKIKCINNGTNTDCSACQQNHRECTYPLPSAASSSSAKRSEHPSVRGIDGEGDTKRPRRRETDSGGRHPYRVGEDPLENPPISSKLWREIYQIFMQHYSAELSFLHKETFFDRIRKMEESGTRSLETQLFLLGILSLTARFVPELVSYPYPSDPSRDRDLRTGDPLNASEFYAHALEVRLDAVTMATPSLDILQALLMLGLHNWGTCRGLRCWVWTGAATRLAYAMGLSSEETIADIGKPDSVSTEELRLLGVKRKMLEAESKYGVHESVNTTIREIKRRIMWSCFILDRYLSSGRSRPHMCDDTLQIQLPCSDVDFQFCKNVKTEFLYPQAEPLQDDYTAATGRAVQVGSSSILSFYIRLVEIWGRFSKWSCAGGRRQEKYIPPWDPRTAFFTLRKQLDDFEKSIPPDLTFSSENLAAHAQGSSITVYTAIHTLCSLCKIVLHREYIPFIPLRCKGPIGPLDEPTFPTDKYDVPTGFWEESAEEIFKSAKEILEIVSANSKRWVSSESPQIAFAIWTAAFVGVYSRKFPYMDTAGHMSREDPRNDSRPGAESVNDATSVALKTLTEMSSRLKMASGWSKTTRHMLEYFTSIIEDYHRNSSPYGRMSNSRPRTGDRKLSLREGGSGGGLEEYKIVEKALKDFGSIGSLGEEDDRHPTPTLPDVTQSRASTSGPLMTPIMKAEAIQVMERLPTGRPATEGAWAPINNSASNGNGNHVRAAPHAFNAAPLISPNSTEALYQQTLPQDRPTSTSSIVMGAPQNLRDLVQPYNRSELAPFAQSESYTYSPPPTVSEYPNYAPDSYHYDHQVVFDWQNWDFDGLSGVVPTCGRPADGSLAFHETNMAPIQNQNALAYY